ncbi:uncharacterized protein KGF55_003629 [Candida pseudojiufengensis]|uniref:uncharacterized protein n=1 Tax=Candida pseudojiufengensis TaxID=497109 RepID=UPI002223F03A|nr:uncharacterized protein KGF55_003629 [Candida pseudojiufengensis]KAI5962553.1 hypothetical protein KGF55_003629 [Candida pseudojiufengensis]
MIPSVKPLPTNQRKLPTSLASNVFKSPNSNPSHNSTETQHQFMFPIEIDIQNDVNALCSIKSNSNVESNYHNDISNYSAKNICNMEDLASLDDSEDETSTLMENNILASSPPEDDLLLSTPNVVKKSSISSLGSNSNKYIKELIDEVEDIHYELNQKYNILENEVKVLNNRNSKIWRKLDQIDENHDQLLNKLQNLRNELSQLQPIIDNQTHIENEDNNSSFRKVKNIKQVHLIESKLSIEDEKLVYKLRLRQNQNLEPVSDITCRRCKTITLSKTRTASSSTTRNTKYSFKPNIVDLYQSEQTESIMKQNKVAEKFEKSDITDAEIASVAKLGGERHILPKAFDNEINDNDNKTNSIENTDTVEVIQLHQDLVKEQSIATIQESEFAKVEAKIWSKRYLIAAIALFILAFYVKFIVNR